MAINIILNGKKEEVPEQISIAGLLKAKNIRPEVVTVELNDAIIERAKYPETLVKTGDRLEFVYYMGGGKQCLFQTG